MDNTIQIPDFEMEGRIMEFARKKRKGFQMPFKKGVVDAACRQATIRFEEIENGIVKLEISFANLDGKPYIVNYVPAEKALAGGVPVRYLKATLEYAIKVFHATMVYEAEKAERSRKDRTNRCGNDF